MSDLAVTLLLLGVAFGLVLMNGFFVAAEFAIVKVRRTRLEELAGQGVKAARISILTVDRLDEYLSATQLGITIVSLALGWIGEESFAELLTLLFPNAFPRSGIEHHVIATGVAFFIITLLHVVIGELVPKSMAIQDAETVSLRIVRPLRAFYTLTKPLIVTFTWLANRILKLLGYHGLEESPLSEEELKLVMKESHEEGVISESEAQIINRAFSFSDKRASQIMVRADQVDFISLARPLEENLATVRRNMHTRFPLCQGPELDSVIGVVHMKDAWPVLLSEFSNTAFTRCRRDAVIVEPGAPQDRLMTLFKKGRAHLAIVKPSNSSQVQGIVTLEDVLEDLVGEILDEHGN